MAFESLSDFETVSFLPHMMVYVVYVGAKYTVILMDLIFGFMSKHYSVEAVATVNIVHIFLFLITLFGSCFCCCGCCFQKRGAIPFLFKTTYTLSAKFIYYFVKTLFGPDEGIVDRLLKHEKVRKDKEGIPKLYIRNIELGRNEVSHLGLLIFAFCLLAGITSWDAFFLEETYECSEDPNVRCFPLARDGLTNIMDLNITDLNLTEAQQHSITDCSGFENISSQITFLCFRWIYNSKAVISTVGGLLTIFILTVKIASSGLIALSEKVTEKVTSWCGERIYVCFCLRCKIGGCLRMIRLIVLVLVAGVELSFGITIFVLYILTSYKHRNGLFMFFDSQGNQVLLICGILSIILLLPIEKYAVSGNDDIEITNSNESDGNGDLERQRSTEDA